MYVPLLPLKRAIAERDLQSSVWRTRMIHKLKGIDMVGDLNSGPISVGEFTEFPLEMSYSGPFRIRTRPSNLKRKWRRRRIIFPVSGWVYWLSITDSTTTGHHCRLLDKPKYVQMPERERKGIELTNHFISLDNGGQGFELCWCFPI